MKLTPLADRVVVSREEAPGKTPGGIILPDKAKGVPSKGKVIAAGEGIRDNNGKLMPMYLKEGDRVLFTTYAGSEVEVDGEKFLILSQQDILAILS